MRSLRLRSPLCASLSHLPPNKYSSSRSKILGRPPSLTRSASPWTISSSSFIPRHQSRHQLTRSLLSISQVLTKSHQFLSQCSPRQHLVHSPRNPRRLLPLVVPLQKLLLQFVATVRHQNNPLGRKSVLLFHTCLQVRLSEHT